MQLVRRAGPPDGHLRHGQLRPDRCEPVAIGGAASHSVLCVLFHILHARLCGSDPTADGMLGPDFGPSCVDERYLDSDGCVHAPLARPALCTIGLTVTPAALTAPKPRLRLPRRPTSLSSTPRRNPSLSLCEQLPSDRCPSDVIATSYWTQYASPFFNGYFTVRASRGRVCH